MKMWSLVVVMPLVMVAAGAELDCSVQSKTLKEVRQEWKRSRNEVLTGDYHACKLKAYNNQRY